MVFTMRYIGRKRFRCLVYLFALVLLSARVDAETLTIATGDNPSVEFVNLIVAVENAKKRGVDIELNFFNSEEMASEAVSAEIADLAVGTPYEFIQNSDEPYRMIVQLNRLRFHPMVNAARYKTWKDLNGADVYVHGKGSGTEAIMQYFAKQHGIAYGNIHYLPGSSVRATAMQQGRINASVVDTPRRDLLFSDPSKEFIALPVGDFNVTDEALYGKKSVIQAKEKEIVILLEEILKAWQYVNADAEKINDAGRAQVAIDLLPQEEKDGLRSYYLNAVKSGAFSDSGGLGDDLREDFAFFEASGALKGPSANLHLKDFWYLQPLQKAAGQSQ